ncbi:MAG: ASKHA domain-containing protein [Bacillota bacterium]
MIKIHFLPMNKVVEVPPGSTVLQAAILAGVQVESTCGGKGTCGKCKVQIMAGKLPPVSPVEANFFGAGQLSAGWALACQRTVTEDTVVELREKKDVHHRKTGMAGATGFDALAPSVGKYPVMLPPPSVEDQTPDWERLLAALPCAGIRFSRPVAASLPRVLRQGNFRVTAVVDGNSLLAVEPGETRERCFGLAVDIGTTTVVVYLTDLHTGRVVASGATTNPQNVFGADVISRITYAASGPEGLRQLQEKVVAGINSLIDRLSREAKVSTAEIYQAVVVGNTTMSHLFLGIDPTYLAPAPFVPAFRQGVEVEAREVGLNILSTGTVVVLPNVAGYVGSDTVGVMLAAGADRLQGINLMVDIGTNGEIVLAGKGRILTCSTAAGPAFEGAEIKCGMRAAEGAIEGVCISGDVELAVIAGGRPVGICGSGLIDAVAEMLKAGVINSSGRLASTEAQIDRLPPLVRQRLRKSNQGSEFVLAWARDTATGEDIVLSQKDIRELQLAKGAIRAGIQVLCREMGISPGDIHRVLLAGAFGNHIKKESALCIGLLPAVPLDRITSIGNAAGDGARLALLSAAERARAAALASGAEHVELSNRKEFSEEFIKSLSFETELTQQQLINLAT